jgi:flagellar biosynthesis component FlhA
MMTAILYPCFSVKIRLCVSQQAGLCVPPITETHLSKVDFPAPKNPQIMVKGTRVERGNLDVEFITTEASGTSMSDLEG